MAASQTAAVRLSKIILYHTCSNGLPKRGNRKIVQPCFMIPLQYVSTSKHNEEFLRFLLCMWKQRTIYYYKQISLTWWFIPVPISYLNEVLSTMPNFDCSKQEKLLNVVTVCFHCYVLLPYSSHGLSKMCCTVSLFNTGLLSITTIYSKPSLPLPNICKFNGHYAERQMFGNH